MSPGATYQSGRDTPSSPALSVRPTVSFTVHAGPPPSSWAIWRSTTWPATRRYAIWSPAGDHAGAQLRPSLVTRSSSAPLAASRMTTSVPIALVRVAAMYFPSGDQAGWR